MKKATAILWAYALAASATAAVPLEKVRALRQERKDDKDRVTILYQFEPGEGEHHRPAAQAALRGREAAEAWKLFGRSEDSVALVARSPFGGGETAKSYWPAGVKPELLRNLAGRLKEVGLKVKLPEVGPEKPQTEEEPPETPARPWPKIGFSADYEFVLLVGLHHEPIPYLGTRRTADGKAVHSRGSRLNAWAILFHAPTKTAFWATTAVARVGYRGVGDPLNLAAETVLGYLDFAEIGTHNIPAHVERIAALQDLHAVDLAAMLVQTQRADAVEAVIQLAMAKNAYRMKPRVLRYFNERGTAQDYRIDPEDSKRRGYAYAAQVVTVRVLLLEQLRGMRSVQAASAAARIPREEDFQIGPLGQSLAGRTQPISAEDEIILIAELAHSDRLRIFRRNFAVAVRSLGKCRVHMDEAMAVAKFYADRKVPPPRRGRRPRRDPLKEAGKAALLELQRARAERQDRPAEKPE